MLRLIQVWIPGAEAEAVAARLQDVECLEYRVRRCSGEQAAVEVLAETKHSEAILDLLARHFSGLDGFRAVVLPVEAMLPRPEPAEEPAREEKRPVGAMRISREELYADVAGGAEVSGLYLATVVLSTLVATIGLMRGEVAIVIGAMVIAPLLGPNVALALATTLGDVGLAVRSLKTNILGMLTALALSLAFGLLLTVDPDVPEIASRTRVGLGDVVLALAAGCAGALAFTSGAPAALVGVMVAVALLPPLVTFGLLLASQNYTPAWGALLLLMTNVICVNLAGVVTFLVRGIRPRTWWETERAKKATRAATTLWIVLLLCLIAVILLSAQR